MLSANRIKLIQSLANKKYRQKYNLFIVEGIKNIKEFIYSDFTLSKIYTIEPIEILSEDKYEIISKKELNKISFLKNPSNALAIVEIPKPELKKIEGKQLVLESIQDPGNMGTLIRLADWFGMEQIICSEDTVDIFNPKVVQASMGSLARVNVVYTNLEIFFRDNQHLPIYATDMDGESIYQVELEQEAFLIMGNEGNGISDSIKNICSKTISIPRFGEKKKTESLNVAMSAGIILGEFFSQKEKNERKN